MEFQYTQQILTESVAPMMQYWNMIYENIGNQPGIDKPDMTYEYEIPIYETNPSGIGGTENVFRVYFYKDIGNPSGIGSLRLQNPNIHNKSFRNCWSRG